VRSFLPSLIALSAMGVVAMGLTIARGGLHADADALRSAVRVAVLAMILQAGHFVEEAATGLNRRLPEVFGLAPVSMESFVTVNVVALVVWAVSAVALAQGSSWALFPFWFLGVASVANAILHPALSLATGGYFPGLVTSPVVGVAGAVLLHRLAGITQGR
jgi:hypothetical protein